MKRILLSLSCILLLVELSVSQEETGTFNFIHRTAQVTLVTPLGTNGVDAGHCVNRLSFNILVGHAAGLKGLEIGGFMNTEKFYMYGIQLAGFANVVSGEAWGVQTAGFANVNNGDATGIQLAGFANVNHGSSSGIVVSGFSNVSDGQATGWIFSGFANVNNGSGRGVFSSGFANVSNGSVTGLQLSGFANVSNEMRGVQLAGFANLAKGNFSSLQTSGCINVAKGDFNGLQLAGLTNVASGNFKGIQLSGVLNRCKKLNGYQLGFINYCDSVESGLPVGFLSIVRKHGFYQLELSAGETVNTAVSFKIGVKRFYNIFSLGSSFLSDDVYYGFGYGLGTQFLETNDYTANLELSGFCLFNTFTGPDNMTIFPEINSKSIQLNQLKVTFGKNISQNMSVFAGASINVQESNISGTGDDAVELSPYTLYNKTFSNDVNLQIWPGATLGVRYDL